MLHIQKISKSLNHQSLKIKKKSFCTINTIEKYLQTKCDVVLGLVLRIQIHF